MTQTFKGVGSVTGRIRGALNDPRVEGWSGACPGYSQYKVPFQDGETYILSTCTAPPEQEEFITNIISESSAYSPSARKKFLQRMASPSRFDLFSMIIHLNDSHKWTREKIADWLDTLDLDLRLAPSV